MGTIADKVRYTLNAVNDIQAAIEEKKISITDATPLKSYGDKIREVRTLDSLVIYVGIIMIWEQPGTVTQDLILNFAILKKLQLMWFQIHIIRRNFKCQ